MRLGTALAGPAGVGSARGGRRVQQPDNLLVEVLHFEIEHPLTGQRLKRTLLRAHDTLPSEGREPVLNWVGIMRGLSADSSDAAASGDSSSRVGPPMVSSKLSGFQHDALEAICARAKDSLFLTGGAALAGFHLGHRRTDALDLFTVAPEAFERTRYVMGEVVVALGATLEVRQDAPGFR